MEPDLDEVKRRLIQAMQLDKDVHEHWLETAQYMIEAYLSMKLRKRLYDISTVGARIRTAREVMGLTQEQLGKVIGVSAYSISNYECGKRPIGAAQLMRIARSLRVKDRWILMETDDGGPPVPQEAMRKQRLKNWQAASIRDKRKHHAKVELERLRGLRPPKPPARAAASDSPPAEPPPT